MKRACATRPGRPVTVDFEALYRASSRHDPALLIKPDLHGPNGAARPGFETEMECVREDRFRAQQLAQLPWGSARGLGELLQESAPDFAHTTLASQRYQRECRRVAVSRLLEQMEGYVDGELRTFTMVKPEWSTAGVDLSKFSPREMLGRLRRCMPQRLNMCQDSWLFAQVHGEFDSRIGQFQPHLHGVCTADYIEPLRASVKACDRAVIRQPLRVMAVNSPDRARQVSYLVQSFWPNRPTIVVDGVIHRARRKGRIPEPWGSMVVLWLHRQVLSSIQLRLGLGNGGIGLSTHNSGRNPDLGP